jgi:hypothetical protein
MRGIHFYHPSGWRMDVLAPFSRGSRKSALARIPAVRRPASSRAALNLGVALAGQCSAAAEINARYALSFAVRGEAFFEAGADLSSVEAAQIAHGPDSTMKRVMPSSIMPSSTTSIQSLNRGQSLASRKPSPRSGRKAPASRSETARPRLGRGRATSSPRPPRQRTGPSAIDVRLKLLLEEGGLAALNLGGDAQGRRARCGPPP